MWNLKSNANECVSRKKQTHRENKLVVTKGERKIERDKLGVWD